MSFNIPINKKNILNQLKEGKMKAFGKKSILSILHGTTVVLFICSFMLVFITVR